MQQPGVVVWTGPLPQKKVRAAMDVPQVVVVDGRRDHRTAGVRRRGARTQAHIPTVREAEARSAVYVGTAVLFDVTVLLFGGTEMRTVYCAGHLTEKALSVDYLFVFLMIMCSFKVPRAVPGRRAGMTPCTGPRGVAGGLR